MDSKLETKAMFCGKYHCTENPRILSEIFLKLPWTYVVRKPITSSKYSYIPSVGINAIQHQADLCGGISF
jgi:hypothetical protein